MGTAILVVITVVVVAVGILLALAASKPNTFRIERSASINAPPEKVFGLIDDFRQWRGWSPWDKIDPDLKRTYCGPASGLGAAYEWQGNNKVGQGRMEIVESARARRIAIKLDFLKPFEAHNIAEFTLEPQGGATHVTWVMRGPNLFMSKVMGTVMNIDRMVGGQFEQGLANMKALAEQ
jgi:uncharacterized protein YndB with AHSA1/START domain